MDSELALFDSFKKLGIALGLGLLVFFLLSEAAGQVTFEYLCGSILLLAVGLIIRDRTKPLGTPSGRFSLVKRLTPKEKKEPQRK